MPSAATPFSIADLPAYDDDLSSLDPPALIDLLLDEEDRAPRSLIDAAARKGDAMVAALRVRLAGPWEKTENVDGRDDFGAWWLRLHAAMILGLLPDEDAGLLLVDLLRWMEAAGDDALQDWLAGEWPALFANKPESVVVQLRAICTDPSIDWYARTNAMDPVVARAERQGPVELDDTLAWVARVAADEAEDWDMRLCCGNILLDFPRERYRPLVEDLARRQSGIGVHFSMDDVVRAFEKGIDEPNWRRRNDPWRFYSPQAIVQRQERWAKDFLEGGDDDDPDAAFGDAPDDASDDEGDNPAEPYKRALPKIGRNDPCPCGSGKKYKKCCLPRLEG
jgi:hypothetical protein